MVTIEALAFLAVGWVSGRLLSGGFLGTFFSANTKLVLTWNLTPTGYLVDMISIVTFFLTCLGQARGWRPATRLRLYLSAGVLIFGCVWFLSIGSRLVFGGTYGSHDGVIETEAAADMLVHGHNPYVADFSNTMFGKFHPPRDGEVESPIVRAYPYPPLVPLLTIPVVVMQHFIHVPVDGRWVTALAFVLFFWVAWRFVADDKPRLWLVLGLLWNAFAFGYWLAGLNDIVFVTAIAIGVFALQRRRFSLSAVAMAAAVAAKQTAVVILVFWVWWLWLEYRDRKISRSELWRTWAITGATLVALYGPFLLWNARAMYDDLGRFVAGGIPHTYPIGGDSIWQFLVVFQRADAWTATHHSMVTAGVLILGSILGLWWLRRHRTIAQMVGAGTMVTLAASVSNRFFFENYASALYLLFVVVLLVDWRERRTVLSPE